MSKSLADLITEQKELERQIHQLQSTARADAIDQIRKVMADNGLTLADIATGKPSPKASPMTGRTVAPKYRDPSSGQTWSGRGLKPKWMAAALAGGKRLEDFAI